MTLPLGNALAVLCLCATLPLAASSMLSAQATAFQPQSRVETSLPGDTWEPAIAADSYGHVYYPDSRFSAGLQRMPELDHVPGHEQ